MGGYFTMLLCPCHHKADEQKEMAISYFESNKSSMWSHDKRLSWQIVQQLDENWMEMQQ